EVLDICDMVAIYDTLFANPDWTSLLAPPSPEPGHDPTPEGIAFSAHLCPDKYEVNPDGVKPNPLGCSDYNPRPATRTDDLIRLGDVPAVPGRTVKVPIYLTASVPTDAVQLVVEYDSSKLEIASGRESLSYEGSFYEQFFGKQTTIVYHDGHSTSTFFYGQSAGVSDLCVHPASGVFTAAIGGHLIFPGFEVP